MNTSRREFIGLGALAALAASGCSRIAYRFSGPTLPAPIEPPKAPRLSMRLAQRVGMGSRPGELAEIESLGAQAWIDRQIRADQEPPLALATMLARLDALRIDGRELRDQPAQAMVRQLRQAAILRAVLNPNGLFERMVDFWTNHLNIYAHKGLAAYRLPTAVEQVVRPHALGSFKEMIRASAKSPAMLAYLDNIRNSQFGPNENYARELLELHTLGVHGGYTQRDVREVARCLTGWTVERRFLRNYDGLAFQEKHHDDGEKIVLGHRIPAGGGADDLERVLDIVLNHPATAKHLAGKLGRHFLGSESGPAIDRAERNYLEQDGQIRPMLEALLTPTTLDASPPVLKRPFDYAVSALRAVAAETDGGIGIQAHLEAMGQPLFEWPMPDGFPDRTESWTGSLLARWNFASALANDEIPGTRSPWKELAERSGGSLGRAILGEPFAHGSSPTEEATLALASPAFMWR